MKGWCCDGACDNEVRRGIKGSPMSEFSTNFFGGRTLLLLFISRHFPSSVYSPFFISSSTTLNSAPQIPRSRPAVGAPSFFAGPINEHLASSATVVNRTSSTPRQAQPTKAIYRTRPTHRIDCIAAVEANNLYDIPTNRLRTC